MIGLVLLALQGGPATVLGTVTDEATRRPLAYATVLLPSLNLAVLTDEGGRYRLAPVPAGPHHLVFRLVGHEPRTLDALVPRDGVLEINVALRAFPVRLPAIDISAEGANPDIPRTDWRPAADRVVALADIRNHPLLPEPDAFQALAGGDIALDPESPAGVHVRGGGSDQVGYLLDGFPVLSPYHVAGMFTTWNPDALAQVEVWTGSPPVDQPDAVGGVIAGTTRTPGDRHALQASLSTSQGRLTADGPLGGGVRYLGAARTGFVPGFGSRTDASFLAAETGDVLGKVEFPLLGGSARLLGYGNWNEISADAGGATAAPGQPRNDFSWTGETFGVAYARPAGAATIQLRAWSASSRASSRWNGADALHRLLSRREDAGGSLVLAPGGRLAGSAFGVRYESSLTRYRVQSDSAGLVLPDHRVRTPLFTGFGQVVLRPLGSELLMGSSITRAAGRTRVSPRGRLRIPLAVPATLTVSAARLHQFAQSLRNPESVVGYVFPAELFAGAGDPAIPVARSDQLAAVLEVVPASNTRIEIQGYLRDLAGLVLAAPGEPEPFATRPLETGSGTVRGLAIRFSIKTRRLSLLGSYGLQSVRLAWGDSSYVPQYGSTHIFEGGVLVFPSPSSSVRIGLSGAAGRRATAFSGSFEWEACNLLDQGCEFGGSPHYGGEPLGGTRLPVYTRVDASLRKHWHLRLAGREISVGVFATATNLLGRRNILAEARNPSTGARTPVEMRPRSPLVLGVDWTF